MNHEPWTAPARCQMQTPSHQGWFNRLQPPALARHPPVTARPVETPRWNAQNNTNPTRPGLSRRTFQVHRQPSPRLKHDGHAGAGGTGEKWWEHIQTFDPEALDQEMDVMVLGNVLGFNSNPAGFQHSVIMQQNITICSGHEMDTDTCAPGHERLVCIDKFAHCTGGDCANKNLDLLSPRNDAFFSRLTTTGLHGDYDLVKATSSAKCPVNMTVHQFGTQLGLGIMGKDLHMTRLVDRSMAGEDASCVHDFVV
ncbi:hypothetical protein T484DRAFT_2762857 [Baffinella frigidus]|nr:hypothetical protein T484DRAFT_2762857 [Cryptophyta sp. CCMP2293]